MGHESLATTAIYVDVPLKQRAAAVTLLPELRYGGVLLGVGFAEKVSQLSLFE
jgi:hypothetical protein